jgi:hypothetical protein
LVYHTHAELNKNVLLMEGCTSYHSIYIHPGRINCVFRSLIPSKSPYKPNVQPEQFKNNSHNGKVSPGMKRKVTRAIDYGTYLAKSKIVFCRFHGKSFMFKLAFLTLTLASKQIHPDQVITNRLLNYFLMELRRRWKAPWYIWRSEKQKNGNLHFHIIVGMFIPWNEIRNVWNRIQNTLGYVDRYRDNQLNWHREGFRYDPSKAPRWPRANQLKAYRQGLRTDWDNPNSTDIHSIRHVGNVQSYFVKYLTKSGQEQPVAGRQWGCSVNLSNVVGATDDASFPIKAELWKIRNSGKFYVVDDPYYSVFFIDVYSLKTLGCPILYNLFQEYIREKFPDQYSPILF